MVRRLGVRLNEVQPSPIGDAFVRFGSPVERERFLDRVIQFGHGYTLRFIKHDEGDHVRLHDLDREVWVMLMLFPNDARNNTALSKAVAGFGLLRYWYDSTNNARVVCKILLHDEAKIPDDVVVSVGLEPRVRTWTCPVYVLKRKGVQIPGDEDVFPPPDGGLAHPFPPPPPRWMGMDGPNDGPGASAIGEEEAIAQPEGTENVQLVDPEAALQPEVVGDARSDPLAMEVQPREVFVSSPPLIVPPLFPPGFENVIIKVNNRSFLISSIPKPIIFFDSRQIKYFFCNLDTIVPSYVSDDNTRRFLASIAFDPLAQEEKTPGLIGPLPLLGPLVPYPASDDEEVQEIESLPPSSSTCKRHLRTMREPLDVAFLRRSARLAQDDGFIDNASAEVAVVDNPSVYTAQHAGPPFVGCTLPQH
ncbi:hypothetical protein HU200_028079 [Digitaria exilis]|uniref:Uncharacterized protein n=1 Tax=Digitaria exilis TaxID=1010633 RepID=A0A835C6S1_9POAL|nr:hypothetical protein HU200_028079 [Digitaria exilis]